MKVKKGLPELEFKEDFARFSGYFYKEIYTEYNLRKMGLNERQIKAVMHGKENGKITKKGLNRLANRSNALKPQRHQKI